MAAPAYEIAFDKTNPHAVAAAREHAARLVREVGGDVRHSIRNRIADALATGKAPRKIARQIGLITGLTNSQGAAVMRLEERLVAAGERATRTGRSVRLRYGQHLVRQRGGRFVTRWNTVRVPPGGLPDDRITRLVDRYTTSLERQRGLLIARTESARAANSGQHELWRQAQANGYLRDDVLREWSTTPDDRACPICIPLDGTTARMEQEFETDNGPVLDPPAHPACRCVVVISEKKAEKRDEVTAEKVYDRVENQRLQDAMLQGTGRDSFIDIPQDVRANVKRQISQRLAKAIEKHPDLSAVGGRLPGVGLEGSAEDIASALVQRWAQTSSDHDHWSIAIQRVAAKEFGIAESTMAHFATKEHVLNAVREIEQRFEGFLRTFVRAQYDQTQAWFKRHGITHVNVHRGMIFAEKNPITGVKATGGITNVQLQPLSSFASSVEEAVLFTDTSPSVANVMMTTRVPVDKVFSTARTGIGCLNESEVVLLGGDVRGFVTINERRNHLPRLQQFIEAGGGL